MFSFAIFLSFRIAIFGAVLVILTILSTRGRAMGLDVIDLENMIDDLQASEQQQSNCMLQLSLMVARLALSSICEDYRDDASQTMLELVRAKRQDAPAHPRLDPEQRRPWIIDMHTLPVSQMPSPTPVNAKFGSGGLN